MTEATIALGLLLACVALLVWLPALRRRSAARKRWLRYVSGL